MRETIYMSSGAFRSRSLADVLTECRIEKVRNLELSSGVRWDPEVLPAVRRERGHINYLVHNYFPPPEKPFVLNLASSDAEQLQISRQHCRAAIDLAAELGNPFYSVHSGFAVMLKPEMLGNVEAQRQIRQYDYEKAFATFVTSVRDLCRYAEQRGMRFLVENNVVAHGIVCDPMRPPLLIARAEEFQRLIEEVNHPGLGLLFDVAHAKVSGGTLGFDPRDFLERAAPHIGAFHLSDNDGRIDSNQPFEAAAWFAGKLRSFGSVPMVIEVYRMAPADMHRQVQVLEQILDGGEP